MQPETGYKIGYKQPPESGRFPPGQSGNPAGRPRGSKNLSTLIRQVTGEKITVIENGRRRRRSKTELMIRQLVNQAVQGELKAIQNVLGLLAKFKLPAAPPMDRMQAILGQLGNLILSFDHGPPEIASTPGSNPETAGDQPGEQKRSRRSPQAPPKLAVLLRNVLFERITITENSRRRRVSKFEAMLQQLANRASEGDLAAGRSMFRLLSQMEQREAEAAKKPKLPLGVTYLPHNYRDPIKPDRLPLQKEFFELQEQQNRNRRGRGSTH